MNVEKEMNENYEKLNGLIDKKIEELVKVGIQQTNIDYLGKLIDAKKDISKIEQLKKEEDTMYRDYDNYGNYGNYGRDYYGGGRRRDSQGRYMEGNNRFGRRYRGDDMIDEMSMHYGTYMENRENGRYGSPEMGKALDYMLKSVEEFMLMLKNDATNQEEVEKIRKTARKISEM